MKKNEIDKKSDLSSLCKAKDVGMEFLVCLENNSEECKFSLKVQLQSFGYLYFCQNPLKWYIEKNMRK